MLYILPKYLNYSITEDGEVFNTNDRFNKLKTYIFPRGGGEYVKLTYLGIRVSVSIKDLLASVGLEKLPQAAPRNRTPLANRRRIEELQEDKEYEITKYRFDR